MGNKLRKVHLYIKKKSPSNYIRFKFGVLIKLFNLFPSAVGDKLFLAIYLIDGLLIIRKKHQFIERIVGNHIECELGGVRNEILTPPLKLQR